MRTRIVIVIGFSLLTGCAQPKPVAPAPNRPIGMSMEEAKQVVASFEDKQARAVASDPLANPKSLEDALMILKRDQLGLFGKGVELTAGMEGIDAQALHAQIELAWGEAQAILGEVLWDIAERQNRAARRLELKKASGGFALEDDDRLVRLKTSATEASRIAQALNILASEHVAAGAKVARAITEQHPDDYKGYRVAADYYRLRGDWDRFDDMVAKIEQTNPDSNGLVFLRGVAAAHRDEDLAAAAGFFAKALENDPEFVRAQTHLFLAQTSVWNSFEAYEKLKALNPNHQIVVWAGSRIEAAYEEYKAQRRQGLPKG